MDIRCTLCGEPWDLDTLHELADERDVTFSEARALFVRDGCCALGTSHNATPDTVAAGVAGILAELAGEDVDGWASDLADAQYFGLI